MLSKAEVVRRTLEKLYDGVATITTTVSGEPDEDTGIVANTTTTVADVPCRVSYSNAPTAAAGDGVMAKLAQQTVLFLAPDIAVQAGSLIDVVHRDRELHFTASGVPKIYDTHQEITLEHRGRYRG